MVEIATNRYHINDHLGSVRTKFEDNNGSALLKSQHHFYPFGKEQRGPWNQDSRNSHLYTGQENQGSFDLGYLRFDFRHSDPLVLNRFDSPDLVSDWAPELNPFRYGFNNPVLYLDPFGLFESRREARKYRREYDLNGRIRKNENTGDYEVHLAGADGRVHRDSDSGEIEYTATATYTGPSIRAYKTNFFENVQNSSVAGKFIYNLADDFWMTFQRFNPFDVHTTHLVGHYATKNEYTMGLVGTAATAVPLGRATSSVKALTPTGVTVLKRLNAAQFSKRFKGTVVARTHPRVRGKLNRLTNVGVDHLNTRVQTGNIVIQGTKIAGKASNDE